MDHDVTTQENSAVDSPPPAVGTRPSASTRELRSKSARQVAAPTTRFQELFEAAPCGYFTVDPASGLLVQSNKALQLLVGQSERELREVALADLLAPHRGGESVAENVVREARSGAQIVDREVELAHRNGDSIWVSFSATSLLDGSDDLVELLCTVIDIRARKREEGERELFEVQFRETQKLETLGLLAGGVAHDFNNLLMTIMGNAEMVSAGIVERESLTHYLDEIQRASQQAAGLCRQLLQYCGKGKTEVRPLRLSQLVGEIRDLLRVSLPPNVHMETRLARLLAPVLGDAKQIQQVIINLVTNAGEAIGNSKGTVRLSTGAVTLDAESLRQHLKATNLSPGEYVYLEVADDGSGMDASTLDRIYDPFFSTKFTGRGLGMAAVSGIVRGHSGTIQVETDLGEGSVFRVFFPAIPEREESTEARTTTDEARRKRGGLVLLADDEAPVLNLAQRMLEHLGYQVVAGHDGNQALELFETHQSALAAVILDLVMPGMGGEEALACIRRHNPELPIIISSGYTEHEISELLANDPHLGFLQKPYSLATLTAKLDGLLGEPEIERDAG